MRNYINVLAESAVMSADIVMAEFDKAMREWASNQYRDYNAYGDEEQWLTTFSGVAAVDVRPEYDEESGVLTLDWYTSDGHALVWAAGHEEERLHVDSFTEQIEYMLNMLEGQLSYVERAIGFDDERQMTTDELVAEMGW